MFWSQKNIENNEENKAVRMYNSIARPEFTPYSINHLGDD